MRCVLERGLEFSFYKGTASWTPSTWVPSQDSCQDVQYPVECLGKRLLIWGRLADLDFKYALSPQGCLTSTLSPHMHTQPRITQGFPRTGTGRLSCSGIATVGSSHTRRSLRTLQRSGCVCQPHRLWWVAADNRHARAPRTHSVYFASLLLSCLVQSVSGVQLVKRVRKKILETNWPKYLAGLAGVFLAKWTKYIFQDHQINEGSTSSSFTKSLCSLGPGTCPFWAQVLLYKHRALEQVRSQVLAVLWVMV